MIEIISEFVVKDEARGRFELMFGPGGAWSRLFGRAAGLRGVTLLRDAQNRHRYLMVEVWDTAAQRQDALAGHAAEHASLEAALADWCEARTDLGVFTMLAQAAVRPPRGGR